MNPFQPPPVLPPPPRIRSPRGLWVLVLVLAIVASTGITGHAIVASRGLVGAASVAPGPFGHPRDADPCTLLQADRLRTFGETTVFSDYGVVASCIAEVVVGAGFVRVELVLDTSTLADIGGEATTVGDLTVRRRVSVSSGYCFHLITTTDGGSVGVSASGSESGGSVCPMADVVVDGAVAVLAAGGVGRRVVSGAPNSLVGQDICALVEAADLAIVPGIDRSRREVGYGGWSCRFGLTPGQQSGPSARLWTSYLGVDGVQNVVTVAGRAVGTYPAQTGPGCSLDVQQRVFLGSSGNQRTEVLAVYVWGGPLADHTTACRSAQLLVERLVPKLPPV